jgi:predicted RNase H-like nuclease
VIRIAGIDGCKRGWVVVHAPSDDLSAAEVSFADDLKAFIKDSKIDFAVVDIPIGFTSGPSDRDVEASMRAVLKGKSSSVFNTPCREALYKDSYGLASEVNRRVLGKGMSKQTFALFPKMREMEQIVRELGQSRIREGHPEVTFATLNNGPVLLRKKDSAGEAARASLLEAAGFRIVELASTVRRLGAAKDDVLDAAAMLWTAKRFIESKHITLPPIPSLDVVGLEMSVIA